MTEKLNILKGSRVPVMHLLSQTTSRQLVTSKGQFARREGYPGKRVNLSWREKLKIARVYEENFTNSVLILQPGYTQRVWKELVS